MRSCCRSCAVLERCLAYVAEQAGAQVDGVRQVADILNRYRGDRSQMLEMLRLYDAKVAGDIEEEHVRF